MYWCEDDLKGGYVDVYSDDELLELVENANPNHDELGRFSTGSGRAKISESKLDLIIENYQRASDEPGTRNDAFGDIAKSNGFDKKPKQLDGEAFDSLDQDSYITLYRGYSDQKESAQAYMKQFREGELWPGNGNYGAGTYTFDKKDPVFSYASGIEDNIQVMKIKKDAKIVDFSKEASNWSNFKQKKYEEFSLKSQDAYEAGDDVLGEQYDDISIKYSELDFGVYAAYKGYDVVVHKPDGLDSRPNIYIILNRGIVTVPKEYN